MTTRAHTHTSKKGSLEGDSQRDVAEGFSEMGRSRRHSEGSNKRQDFQFLPQRPDPRRVSEGVSEGVSEVFSKSETLLKPF